METKKINTPFGYFGSKNRLALQLCENLPPHNCWVDAFCGSAAMTLAKSPAPIEIINDIDSEVVNFFKQLRDNFDELIDLINLTPYSSEELSTARIENKNDSDLERARKFSIQAMMAINGAFGEGQGGFSTSPSYTRNNREARVNRWNMLPLRLKKVVERLKDTRIENQDAAELLKKYIHRPATLVYLDPPYLGKRINGYKNEANDHEFHRALLEIATNAKCMIFISGYENELYDSMLTPKKGWKRKSLSSYTKGANGHLHSRTEFVWMNQFYVKALQTKKLPIKLTDKEKKNNKVNPERI